MQEEVVEEQLDSDQAREMEERRKSEPIATLCDTMRKQIISR
jgi:hypothetical protein